MSEEPKHDGNLGHNASVLYWDEKYITKDGETFVMLEVLISDKTRRVVLTPKESLSLLAWLEQERPELERLAKETCE